MNITKFVPKSVVRATARQTLVVKKHSPAILFGAGVVGMVATVVTASRATLKLEDELSDHLEKCEAADSLVQKNLSTYTQADYEQDKKYLKVRIAISVAKLYAPSFALGVLSIACLTGSHKILTNRNASLTAAYTAVDMAFREYRKRVVDEFGEKKDRELRYGVVEEKILVDDTNGPKKKTVKKADPNAAKMYARFFNSENPNWNATPEYNLIFLRGVQNYLNDRLNVRGHLTLNEVYDELGMERSTEGFVVGWLKDSVKGDGYVDFGVWTDRDLTKFHDFLTGRESELLLDFNVDGNIFDELRKRSLKMKMGVDQ